VTATARATRATAATSSATTGRRRRAARAATRAAARATGAAHDACPSAARGAHHERACGRHEYDRDDGDRRDDGDHRNAADSSHGADDCHDSYDDDHFDDHHDDNGARRGAGPIRGPCDQFARASELHDAEHDPVQRRDTFTQLRGMHAGMLLASRGLSLMIDELRARTNTRTREFGRTLRAT
jgi:hypothetical protein